MNMSAMMKQAQQLQKKMMKEKEQIDAMTFETTKSFVCVQANGKKEILNIKIDMDKIENDEIEMVQDLILVAVNETLSKIDKEVEDKMGKYTRGLPF